MCQPYYKEMQGASQPYYKERNGRQLDIRGRRICQPHYMQRKGKGYHLCSM
jgi:hypothetical protein